ncbi:MAG: 3-phosphoshikimate 1-carboxyvinyltransferase [Deltaproteobacteria bacterium]|nr:3-phosphoshikimate 1-carboxyvinyltransferase [Deltaproteobacteria bacterium]MBN2846290.1 3-phosphoshikimate 1-carboxyvinyltransferase [Deltaproteobacteria bacterium]
MREIKRLKNLKGTVMVPGSKSLTQRALVIAALAHGRSHLTNPLLSEDTNYLIDALRSLGTDIRVSKDTIAIEGSGPKIGNPERTLFLGNNGTALRFLATMVALGTGTFIIDGNKRLRERPVAPLMEALKSLGIECHGQDRGYPPVIVEGRGEIPGGTATFLNTDSSQYISSLLISSPYARRDVTIKLKGITVSMPYIAMTVDTMNSFGGDVIKEDERTYRVPTPQYYRGRDYAIEGDMSSASYFFLAAVLCRGRVRVHNINPNSIQGDRRILAVMEKLGCKIEKGDTWVEVKGGNLCKEEHLFDMGDMPDMVPTLAVLAASRSGRTIITNVPHLRVKESDRIKALVTELQRVGIEAKERKDGLVINGGIPHGAEIETYGDHRIAMSFAVLGLATDGIFIKNEGCVSKSFPGFWNELDRL